MTRVQSCFALIVLLGATGCQLERFFPDQVGVNLARLSVRHVGQVTQLISADTNCGFESQAVKEAVEIQGEVGDIGVGTWSVYKCEIALPEETVLSTDCKGTETRMQGTVVVTAIKTVRGHISGNPENPIIPMEPDAATFEILAEFENHTVIDSSSEARLKVHSGSAYYFAEPHLAVSASQGVCSIPTSEITLRDIIWQNAAVEIDSGTSTFDVDVPKSSFTAQVGRWKNVENQLEGSITVWDTEVNVTELASEEGLDPDYKRNEFLEGFSCHDDLTVPHSYECQDLTPRFAQGVAQLSILTFGNIIKLTEDNTECGFSAPDILDNPTLTGELGFAGGQARYEISQPCRIEFTEKTNIDQDCLGVQAFATGVLEVTGTKVVSGYRTGSSENPIVPTNRDPAVIHLDVAFHGFSISESDHTNQFFIESGTMSGTATPRTAIDLETGACSIPTPVIHLQDIAYENVSGIIHSDGNQFRLNGVQSSVTGVNGPRDGEENVLTGEVTIDGATFPIPVQGEPVLDPEYTLEKFTSEYACTENMEIPSSDADCNFSKTLGEGTARLLVQSIGTIAGIINGDDSCGFEAYLVKMLPDEVIGDSGEMGSMTWSIDDCTIGSSSVVIDAEDCNGAQTYIGGYATVDATRTVHGEREKVLFLFDSIIPKEHQAVQLSLDNVELSELVSYSIPGGESEPLGKLTIHSGQLSAVVEPILGERSSEPGSFEVTTPVAVFSDIKLTNAKATLESEGNLFVLDIADSHLSATNGKWNASTNTLSGTIRVNGSDVSFDQIDLNPDFVQSSFDDSYECNDDLMSVID